MNAQSPFKTADLSAPVLAKPDLSGHDIVAPIPADFRLQSGEKLEQADVIARVYGPANAPVVVAAGGISAGRVLFAAMVACGAWYVQFRLFRTNGLLWSLAACSTAVPLIDRLLPGAHYSWPALPRAADPTPAAQAA